MHTRVVVADQSEARFYDLDSVGTDMHLKRRLTDAAAHLRNQDLVSDKPGRVFDRAAPMSARRGAVSHHGTGGERSPRKHEALSFARAVVAELDKDRGAGEFDQLVLMAGPEFLGLLRESLPKTLEHLIAAEINKDLIRQPDAAIKTYLPWEDLRFPTRAS
jgi:protein required for attachment to host cells